MTKFNAKDISLKDNARGQNKFCELWPPAKVGLQALAAIVKNPFLRVAIEGIIAAGDAIARSICG